MKNWLTQAVAGLAAVTMLASCEKDETRVTVQPGDSPALAASTAVAGVLTSANAAKPIVKYTFPAFTSTTSGPAVAMPMQYELQVAKTGTNFAAPTTIAVDTVGRKTLTIGDLNTALIKAGLTPDVEGTVDVRLRTVYAANSASLYSNVTTIKATPYSRELYLFGSAFALASAPYIQERDGLAQQYEGYVYFPQAGATVKLSNTQTSSGTVFGTDATNRVVSGGTNDITFRQKGMYRVRLNLATGALDTVHTVWGLVGSATTNSGAGWDASKRMTYNDTTKMWTFTGNIPGAGSNNQFKFRANDAWAINLGLTKKATDAADLLEQDGDNINLSSPGTYTVSLDLNTPNAYKYTIK
ncbi:SusE domain-containing protein [Hymenobacter sp. ASUV-10]|uniref:SusE domain-containing protein n=1 Tax=Hymenobacter aranciens TaxID=3063996 RepID=A0ABT9BGG1_9BACT|nr:SusE domain-containing protein [Hymenobacter sp. ASUV-10]MDO7876117.1 SusE domain-containing protein [Hymenobacter sp. ASUV-10]